VAGAAGTDQRIKPAPMPVGSGAALLGGVADGDGGSLVTIVGVGTGGSVSGGNGDSEIDGNPPAGAELGSTVTGAAPAADGAPDVVRGGFEP
jgi:hypothetical protein